MASRGKYLIIDELSSRAAPVAGRSYAVENAEELPGKQLIMHVIDVSVHTHSYKNEVFEILGKLRELSDKSPYFSQILEIHKDEREIWWLEPKLETVVLKEKFEVHWTEKEIYRFIYQLSDGLDQWWRISGRAHGNLNSQNIFFAHTRSNMPGVRTETWPIISGFDLLPKNNQDEALKGDLLALSKIIIEVVTKECCDDSEIQFPLHPHPGWENLGHKKNYWLNLASWLAYPGLNLNELNVGKLKSDLSKTEKPSVRITLASAFLVLCLSLGIAAAARMHFWAGRESVLYEASGSQPMPSVISNKQELDRQNKDQKLFKSFAPKILSNVSTVIAGHRVSTNNSIDMPKNNRSIKVDIQNKLPTLDGDEWVTISGLAFVFIKDLPEIKIDPNSRTFFSSEKAALRDTNAGGFSSKGGYFGLMEVSQSVFRNVMGDNPSIGQGPDLPVNSVSWDEAQEFCRRLTAQEIAAGRLPDGWLFAIPTRDQINHLVGMSQTDQSGKELLKNKGDNLDFGEVLSLNTRRFKPESVDYGQADNKYRVSGLIGNVKEWCFEEVSRKAMTAGWSYDFTGNTDERPFFDTPKVNRSFKKVGFRCVVVKAFSR